MVNYRNEIKEIMDAYTLFDNDFMAMFFESNKEAVELLLNIILERNDLSVKSVLVEKEERAPEVQGRSVRFDILATDHDNKKYDIEIQRSSQGASPQRARFYSSVLDSRMLSQGQDFKEMKESYVIFITENDVMKKNQALYHIDRVIDEMDEKFNDGNHIIYVNGAYKNEETEIGKLVHDLNTSQADDLYYEVLKKGMQHYKGGKESMTKAEKLMEEFGERRKSEGKAEGKAEGIIEGKAEGIAEGKAEGNLEGVVKLGKEIGMTDEMIISKLIKMFQVDENTAKQYLKETVI